MFLNVVYPSIPEFHTMLRGPSIAVNFVYDFGLGFFTTLAFGLTLVYCAWQHSGTIMEALVRLMERPRELMSFASTGSELKVITYDDALIEMEMGGRSTAVSPTKIVPLVEIARPIHRIKSWDQDKAECSVGFGAPLVNQP